MTIHDAEYIFDIGKLNGKSSLQPAFREIWTTPRGNLRFVCCF